MLTASNQFTDLKILQNKKVAIVYALFNKNICEGLLAGAVGVLESSGFDLRRYQVFSVPGAFEIPLVCKKIAASGRFDGVVALGCVIRGDTPHFEFVSLATSMGVLQAGLDTGCPITFGVITVNDEKQALERSASNEFNKGREAVLALFETWRALSQIEENS